MGVEESWISLFHPLFLEQNKPWAVSQPGQRCPGLPGSEVMIPGGIFLQGEQLPSLSRRQVLGSKQIFCSQLIGGGI